MNYNISNYMKIKPQINDIVQIEWTPYELELNFWESILILMLWILIQFLGNGLLLGLIQYNRFGEDPLKRRISDQVSKKYLICPKRRGKNYLPPFLSIGKDNLH